MKSGLQTLQGSSFANQQAKRAEEFDAYFNAGKKWTSSYDDNFIVTWVLFYSEEELEEVRELIKAQEAFEEAEALTAEASEGQKRRRRRLGLTPRQRRRRRRRLNAAAEAEAEKAARAAAQAAGGAAAEDVGYDGVADDAAVDDDAESLLQLAVAPWASTPAPEYPTPEYPDFDGDLLGGAPGLRLGARRSSACTRRGAQKPRRSSWQRTALKLISSGR